MTRYRSAPRCRTLCSWAWGSRGGNHRLRPRTAGGAPGAAGIAGAVLAASWLIKGYRHTVPLFDNISFLSWFYSTENHRPIAGVYDWPSLIPLAALVVVAGAIGVVLFERKDIGDTGSLRTPDVPQALLGLRGPLGRSLSERLAVAVYWGLGIGFFGLIVGASGDGLRDAITENASLESLMRAAFPALDLHDPGFMLQLMFVQIGTLLAGLGAATVLGGWASDEQDGRLEMLLTTSIARGRWFLGSGAGALLALIATAVVASLGAGLGVALSGENPGTPIVGGAVLALYAMAATGVGLAIGGLLRASWAAVATAVVVVSGLMIEILVPALDLPAWVLDLTLNSHYGEPMVGNWDLVGIVASLVLAVGGLLIGAWGFSRRELQGMTGVPAARVRISKDPGERREELLVAAGRLFQEQGYERTSVQAITDAVGVAKGLFYHYFHSKADLLNDLAAWQANLYVDALPPVAEMEGDAARKLRDFVGRIVQWKFEDLRTLTVAYLDVLYRAARTGLYGRRWCRSSASA